MKEGRGAWYGKRRYFGFHYDLHANERDTELGKRATVKELAPMLRLVDPDFVQTDCKGHPGMTSWFSRVANATVSQGVVKDALAGWRAATRKLGLPLACHYSGLWDKAAAKKHPSWAIVHANGKRSKEKMCPRGPYLEKLMIPQLKELIDRYQVDGFWVDGELWALEPCFCKRCSKAYREETGKKPPKGPKEADWAEWMYFTRRSMGEYVKRYTDAVHEHKPGVLVCSNWIESFRDPGNPDSPTDWLSGDNDPMFGVDWLRREARFMSTREKPWDLMLWTFYKSGVMGDVRSPWTSKSVDMIRQEAGTIMPFGGNIQVYENPGAIRDGRLIPWRQKRIAEVRRFVEARRGLCQGTETIGQIAVLHSEHQFRTTIKGGNQMLDTEAGGVHGAVWSLLELHYGVDVLDEWALLRRLREFPVVVAGEQDHMSEEAVKGLVEYVRRGGRLIVSGSAGYERFGGTFLGVRSAKVEKDATYFVGSGEEMEPIFSGKWRLLRTTKAKGYGRMGRSMLPDERLLGHPAFTVNRVGRGAVAYVPFDVFHSFEINRYVLTREFVGEVVRALGVRFGIRVAGPSCVDVTLRRKGKRVIVHLLNRVSGMPNRPNNPTVDEIPWVGPVTVEMDLLRPPRGVELAWEDSEVASGFLTGARGGTLRVKVERVRIHSAVVVEGQ